MIDIESVNKIVAEIEAKKKAISEAAECGKTALDNTKPKVITAISFQKSKIKPFTTNVGSYTGCYEFRPNGKELTEPVSQYTSRVVEFNRNDLIGIAAIIYKAFEPTAEEWQSFLDKVEVK